MEDFKKTSLVHRDIGEHEHEMVIFNSYEVHAVCMKCGLHDWSEPGDGKDILEYFKEKYPNAAVDESN